MSASKPIGDLLDSLGVTRTGREGDMVTDAVVVLKTVEPNGDVRHQVVWSDGISWIERRGLLEVAVDIERITPQREDA